MNSAHNTSIYNTAAHSTPALPVYAVATNIASSLGKDVAAHWAAAASLKTGIKQHSDASVSPAPFWGARIDASLWQHISQVTKAGTVLSPFEQMSIYSAGRALENCEEQLDLSKTIFILSTTKGNIEWLDQVPDDRTLLHTSAGIIAAQLGIRKSSVVSHACVSGVVAVLYALRLLQAGHYRHAVVTGADRFTKFVLSGFQSFQAIADEPCKPFDADRKGINLGEAAATIILSADLSNQPLAQLRSGSTSNDANHISGPSRTGEELSIAITRALAQAHLKPSEIDMISAHGTATLYNDEMESKAFAHAGVQRAALHSFKGFTGHTLGAAGILESAMLIESLRRQQLIPSVGYTSPGTTQLLNVTRQMAPAAIKHVLKTASGFGGCNATAIWSVA